ncbi:hypothetical protein [uncultured Microbacterium sp.]|uniref:hypothetical protein n=1 Tax=uncultured Microbacterium sp. TaxID=191216 RepID=UPI00262F3163|nr:hypothetical protein [uncultured Microbacterium sp.]
MNPWLLHLPGALLSPAELSAARLDGLLFEVGDAYMPADLPENEEARALSLRPLLVPGYGLCGPTAAWVLGAGDTAPLRHHLQRVTKHRPRVAGSASVVLHEMQAPAEDLISIASLPVTNSLRTLCDLALWADRDPNYEKWFRLFAECSTDLLEGAVERLRARTRMPGKRAAIARLEEISSSRAIRTM